MPSWCTSNRKVRASFFRPTFSCTWSSWAINQYKNNRNNLNYALADADATRSTSEKAGTGLFSQTHVHDLRNDRATKENILAAFEKGRSASAPAGVFTFYYAGHGVLNTQRQCAALLKRRPFPNRPALPAHTG